MAEIVESISGDKALRLYNEQFGRRMGFGAAWGHIRILVRFVCNATSNINDSGLVVGVCQGTDDMFRSANCVDFVGAHLGATLQNVDWSYNAGPPAYASSGGFSTFAFHKQGATVTSTTPGGSTLIYMPISPTRGVFGCDIKRAHNIMKVRPLGQGSVAVAQTDLNEGNLLFQAENDVSTTALIGSSPNYLNVTYTGEGALDSVCVDWNNGIQPIEISDIIVIRFY